MSAISINTERAQAQKVRRSVMNEKIGELMRAVYDIREHPGDPLYFSNLKDAADNACDLLKISEDYSCKLERELDAYKEHMTGVN